MYYIFMHITHINMHMYMCKTHIDICLHRVDGILGLIRAFILFQYCPLAEGRFQQCNHQYYIMKDC